VEVDGQKELGSNWNYADGILQGQSDKHPGPLWPKSVASSLKTCLEFPGGLSLSLLDQSSRNIPPLSWVTQVHCAHSQSSEWGDSGFVTYSKPANDNRSPGVMASGSPKARDSFLGWMESHLHVPHWEPLNPSVHCTWRVLYPRVTGHSGLAQ
jgi:hypothetical protein